MPDTTKTITKAEEPVYTPHPCTALFPPMSPEQEADLHADIERNGLRERIIIDQHGRIVDGVHRYRACIKLGIEPEVEQRTLTDEEAWALSISRNLARRHLSEAQRAAISAELRKSANLPVTQVDAARAFNICERMQRSAETVFAASPELHQAVKEDKLSVHAAEQIANLPAVERDAAIEKVKQGDPKGARKLAKTARAEASNKPKDADKKSTKPTVQNAPSAEVKEAADDTPQVGASSEVKQEPLAEKAKPTKKSRKKQEGKFSAHPVYAPLFQEIGELVPELGKVPTNLSTHPLPPREVQHLIDTLYDLRGWTDTAINAAKSA